MKTLHILLPALALTCAAQLRAEAPAFQGPVSPAPGKVSQSLFWIADTTKMDAFLANIQMAEVRDGAYAGETLPDTRMAWRDYAQEATILARNGKPADAAERLGQMLKLAAVYRSFGGLQNVVRGEEIRTLAGLTAEKLGTPVTSLIRSPYLEKDASDCLMAIESKIGAEKGRVTPSFWRNFEVAAVNRTLPMASPATIRPWRRGNSQRSSRNPRGVSRRRISEEICATPAQNGVMGIMKRPLLSALCAAAALSLFAPDSQAQASNNNGTGTTSSGGTSSGTGASTGTGQRRRGGGEGLEEKHAREIIAKYDKDGDHALNATELAAFFEALHQRVAEHRAQQTSSESSNQSTSTTTSPSAGKGQRAAGTPQEHAARAIEKFDKNGDGKLEVGEVAAMLRAIRERLIQERGGQRRAAPGATPTSTTST